MLHQSSLEPSHSVPAKTITELQSERDRLVRNMHIAVDTGDEGALKCQ